MKKEILLPMVSYLTYLHTPHLMLESAYLHGTLSQLLPQTHTPSKVRRGGYRCRIEKPFLWARKPRAVAEKMVVNPINVSSPGTEGKCLSKKVVVMGCAGTSWVQRTFGVSTRLVSFAPESLHFLQFSEHDPLLSTSRLLNIIFPLVITLIPISYWGLSLTNSDSTFKSQFIPHFLSFSCIPRLK